VIVAGSSAQGTNTDFVKMALDPATGASIWLRSYDGPSHQLDEASDVMVSPDGTEVIVFGVSDDGASDTVSVQVERQFRVSLRIGEPTL
jgi:hypothetical protein